MAYYNPRSRMSPFQPLSSSINPLSHPVLLQIALSLFVPIMRETFIDWRENAQSWLEQSQEAIEEYDQLYEQQRMHEQQQDEVDRSANEPSLADVMLLEYLRDKKPYPGERLLTSGLLWVTTFMSKWLKPPALWQPQHRGQLSPLHRWPRIAGDMVFRGLCIGVPLSVFNLILGRIISNSFHQRGLAPALYDHALSNGMVVPDARLVSRSPNRLVDAGSICKQVLLRWSLYGFGAALHVGTQVFVASAFGKLRSEEV